MGWITTLWEIFLTVTGISQWFSNRTQQKIGQNQQKIADLQAQNTALKQQAQAEANSPLTLQDSIAALKEGKE